MQRLRQEKIGGSSFGSPLSAPIVIIGSGASGLMCASILRKYGLDVIVLEAQNYVGFVSKFLISSFFTYCHEKSHCFFGMNKQQSFALMT